MHMIQDVTLFFFTAELDSIYVYRYMSMNISALYDHLLLKKNKKMEHTICITGFLQPRKVMKMSYAKLFSFSRHGDCGFSTL